MPGPPVSWRQTENAQRNLTRNIRVICKCLKCTNKYGINGRIISTRSWYNHNKTGDPQPITQHNTPNKSSHHHHSQSNSRHQAHKPYLPNGTPQSRNLSSPLSTPVQYNTPTLSPTPSQHRSQTPSLPYTHIRIPHNPIPPQPTPVSQTHSHQHNHISKPRQENLIRPAISISPPSISLPHKHLSPAISPPLPNIIEPHHDNDFDYDHMEPSLDHTPSDQSSDTGSGTDSDSESSSSAPSSAHSSDIDTDTGSDSDSDFDDVLPPKNIQKLTALLQNILKPLYIGTVITTLAILIVIFRCRTQYKFKRVILESIFMILHWVLPKGHNLPSYSDARIIMAHFGGINIQHIPVCASKGCDFLFWNRSPKHDPFKRHQFADTTHCPKCNEPRY